MNLNPLLLGNIRTNDYFKQLAEKRTFEELVDQVLAPGSPRSPTESLSERRSITIVRWPYRGFQAPTIRSVLLVPVRIC